MGVNIALYTQGPMVGIRTSGPCQIFLMTMKRQGWNNGRLVEYLVVIVKDVSHLWNGARRI